MHFVLTPILPVIIVIQSKSVPAPVDGEELTASERKSVPLLDRIGRFCVSEPDAYPVHSQGQLLERRSVPYFVNI